MAKKKSQISTRGLILMIVGFLALILFAVISILSKRVELPPRDAVGNTAGNLNNGGLFFEMDGVVYFSNVSDSNCLYSMNADETNIKKLSTMHAQYINGYDKYLYFYMDSSEGSVDTGLGAAINQFGLYRSDLKGNHQLNLVRDLTGVAQLVGPYIYYQVLDVNNKGTLNKIRIDRKEEQVVVDECVSPACVYNGVIYYSGVVEDHDLHSIDTNVSDRRSVVLNGIYFNPIVEYPYMYYMNELYKLCRVSMLTNETEILTDERIDFFNMNSQYIFYSVSASDTPCIKRMSLDGSNVSVIADGIYNSIHVTSKYLYFKPYGADNVMYHMPIDGGIVSTFRPTAEK